VHALNDYLKFLFKPFKNGWTWLGLFACWTLAYPGFQQLMFAHPDFRQLSQSTGKVTFLGGAYQYRSGQPFFLITPDERMTFACRAVSLYRADCFSDEVSKRIEGKPATVWWFPQSPWFFWEREKKVFQIAIAGEVVLKFSEMMARYKRQTSRWNGYVMAFPLLICFPLFWLFV
jgi:hypothetical protein